MPKRASLIGVAAYFFAVIFAIASAAIGQVIQEKDRYANTPDELIPYQRQEPYKRYFVTPLEYNGPGRGKEEPAGIDTVKIGVLVPRYQIVPPSVSLPDQYVQMGNHVWQGAVMALDEANDRGGYRGKIPFGIAGYNDPILDVKDTWLWGPFTNHVVDAIYRDRVWAILGTIGGENTHILIRIALRAEIPVLTPADTDPSYPETRIPWAFRSIADDRSQCYVLAKYAYEKIGYKRIAALRVNARYGRLGIKEFRDASRRLGYPLVAEMKYRFGDSDFSRPLQQIKELAPDAVVTWGNARESALILKQMREMGMTQPLLGSDRMVTDEFLKIAGKHADGVVAGYPWDPTSDDPILRSFADRYARMYGEPPETYAAHAYDGMNMLIRAIENAGLNRAKIRDALDDMKGHVYHGVTGDIPLNDIYSDVGPIAIATVRDGKFTFQSEEKAGVSLTRRAAPR